MTDTQAEQPDELEQQIAAEINKDSAPLETETEEAPKTTEAVSDGEQAEEPDSGFVETDKDKVQARFNRLTWEREEARREAERYKQQLAERENAKPVETAKGEAPKLADFKEEDFDYDSDRRYEAYAKAVAQFEADNRFSSYLTEQQQRQAEQERQAHQDSLTRKYLSEVEKYADKNPSYYDDVYKMPVLQQETLDVMRDAGAKVVHYIAKNAEIANELAKLSPYQAAMKIGAISERLSTMTKTKPTTKAPEPVDTISGSGKQTKDLSELSMEEIMKL